MRKLIACLLAVTLVLLFAESAACPTTEDLREYATNQGFSPQASLDEIPINFEVPPGCPVLIPGATIRTPAAEQVIVDDLAKLKAAIHGKNNEIAVCRKSIPRLEAECQGKLDEAAAKNAEIQRRLASIPEPPSRTTWALIGAGSTAVAVIIYGSIRGWSP